MAGALAQLSPEIEDVDHCIEELLLRDLIVRETRATIHGEQAYKFKHVLIREVAYSGLAKSARADLHHAFAEWLHDRAGDELLEIRAFHLDQAAMLLAELDGSAPAELREETADALTNAGKRALSREAFRSARKLLLRAVELARHSIAAISPAARRGGSQTSPPCSSRWARSRTPPRSRRDTAPGTRLTALAEAVLQHRADAVTARGSSPRRSTCSRASHPRSASSRSGSPQVAAWFGDSDGVRALGEGGARRRTRGRAQGSRGEHHPRARHRIRAAARARRGGAARRCARSSSPTRAAVSSAAPRRSACAGWLQLVSERPSRRRPTSSRRASSSRELGNTTREAG